MYGKTMRVFCLFSLATIALKMLSIFSPPFAFAASKTIVFTNNQWDSQMFHNELAKFIVENGFEGYRVELSTGSTTLNWQGIINGDVDLDIESWTDNVATYNDDVARKDIIPLGILVPDSAQGFYVPRYVIEGDPARGIKPLIPDLKNVWDLIKYADVFKDPEDSSRGRIYGAIPGWMIDEVLHNKYEYYKLNEGYNYFRVGSEAVLFASLASAYNLGEPWVGYCYEPTWITGKLDMVLLGDAPYDPELFQKGECEIPKQALRVVCGGHFPEKAPELVDFFSKYKTGSAFVSEALAYLEETKESHARTIVWFLKQHDSLLDEWLTPEQAKKVREAVAKQ
ncbi:MAG: ABC transporter substrate-binding protein [Synergistaceae bacterium]|jgi:glycine betaine/proline transport system permease protein/glycine betaine/proline transport system substrate-binding protein|nr:ABC transporter substrate-binding protein [Synergistaceae bacterium]